jgi:hypothetical protein
MSNILTSYQHSAKALGVVLAATVLTGSAAFAAPGTPPSVIAMNQKLKNDSVSITYAYMPKAGTLDIYSSNSSGKMSSKPIGSAKVPAGDHRNIDVKLNKTPKSGAKLWAVLERPGDKGVFKDHGTPAEQSFKVLGS